MSSSRALALWRLARAVPRAAALARPKGQIRQVLPSPMQRYACVGLRQLSSQSNSGPSEGPPELSSMSHPEPGKDADSSVDLDSESTSESDTSSSDSDTSSSDSDMSSSDSDSDDPSMTSDLDDLRSSVLEAALLYVPAYGWTPAALEEGAKDLGLSESDKIVFPRGAGELIDYFEVQCNAELLDYMKQNIEEESEKGSEFLEDAVEQRLRMIIPFISNWPQAMALKAFPTNAPTALEHLALMVDDIWHCAGDRSTDHNWYTKRALLATIYSSTELYMVQDTSVDFQETWEFLSRRMEDANTFGKVSKEMQGVVSGGMGMLSAGVTTALNMLGMNSRSR